LLGVILRVQVKALLLEGQKSGKPTPLTRADFAEIKNRGISRLKTKKVD
jgi:hypothetical protein